MKTKKIEKLEAHFLFHFNYVKSSQIKFRSDFDDALLADFAAIFEIGRRTRHRVDSVSRPERVAATKIRHRENFSIFNLI